MQFDLRRGRHAAIVTVKSRGDVTLVGPFRAGKVEKDSEAFPPSMPAWFRQNGYTTVSVGKVSHHPGGRGGPDWDDEKIPEMPNSWDRHLLPSGAWQHPRGWMHGLANGEIRVRAGKMDVLQMLGDPYTDEEIAAAADAVNGKTEMQALVAYLQGLGLARSGR